MASVRAFHRYRGESSFTMARFIAVLREQLPHVAPSQTKYRVTAVPSERTIRFYTATSLVDKPVGRDGAQALYGYRHLLQVLAIKYLQSQYLPLVKIRSLVENVSNRDLELLIPDIAPANATHRGLARYTPGRVDNSAYQHVDKGLRSTIDPPERTGDESPSADRADTWRRLEIGPGIELHVHAAALSEPDVERLRGALLREIGVLRGWFGEGKR